MRYSEVASEPAEEFLLVEDDEAPFAGPSNSNYLTSSPSTGWNTTRVIHVFIIVVCILSTAGSILFAIFNGGTRSATKAAILEVTTVPSPTVANNKANVSVSSSSTSVSSAENTTVTSSIEKAVNGTGPRKNSNEEYVEAKAMALEESAVDLLPRQISSYQHLVSPSIYLFK